MTKDLYMEQTMRCSGLMKFPQHPEGIKELRATLRGLAPTVALARQIIDAIMRDRDTCPTPHELTIIGGTIRRAAEQLPEGCDICAGQPWVSIEKVERDINEIEYVWSGARRCTCAKGRWFQMKDRENNALRAAGLPV